MYIFWLSCNDYKYKISKKKKIEKNKGLCKFSMMFTVEIYYPFLYTCNSIQISPTVLDF